MEVNTENITKFLHYNPTPQTLHEQNPALNHHQIQIICMYGRFVDEIAVESADIPSLVKPICSNVASMQSADGGRNTYAIQPETTSRPGAGKDCWMPLLEATLGRSQCIDVLHRASEIS